MSTVSVQSPGQTFGRFIKTLAICRGDVLAGEQYAAARNWTSVAMAMKAAVNPMDQSILDQGLAPITSDLSALLRSMTIIGRLAGMRKVPFRTRMLTQSVGGSGSWVDEGEPIPVTAMGIGDTTTLDAKKCAGIRVLTEELLRNATTGTDLLVAVDAASALVEAMDTAFIDPANGGSGAKPASICSGAQQYSSTGSTVSAIDADLKLLLNVLIGADCDLSTAAFIMSPITATHLALLRGSGGAPAFPSVNARGGTLLGLPVICSTNVAASGSPGGRQIVLVEASQIDIADDGQAAIELSTKAALQMNDAPASGAQQVVSLFQLGMVGVRSTRFVNWRRRRVGAVACLRDVAY